MSGKPATVPPSENLLAVAETRRRSIFDELESLGQKRAARVREAAAGVAGAKEAIREIDRIVDEKNVDYEIADVAVANIRAELEAIKQREADDDKRARFDAFAARVEALVKKAPRYTALQNEMIDFLDEWRSVHDTLPTVNNDLPDGVAAIVPPEITVRHAPAASGIAKIVDVVKQRMPADYARNNNRHGGPGSIEQFVEKETVFEGGEPAFRPQRLDQAVELPPLRRGDRAFRIPQHLR